MMMKMVNPSNDPSLFYADVMISLFCMFCQSGGARPPMLDVRSMLINPFINWSTSLTNIRGPTWIRNDVSTLPMFGVYRVLNWPKRTLNSAKGPKCWRNLMIFQDPCNFIRGPLNKRKMNFGKLILGIILNLMTFFNLKESSKTLRSAITIPIKNFKEVGFSSSRRFSSETRNARVAKVLSTPSFLARKWWELAWRYCSAWEFSSKKLDERKNRHPFWNENVNKR